MSNLTRRDASATSGGELTTGAQTIAGAKTFSGATTLSGGLLGKTDGVAVAASYIGQYITWVTPPTGFNVPSATPADWPNAVIVLPPGVWHVTANLTAYFTTGAGSGNEGYTVAQITDSANTLVPGMEKLIYAKTAAAVSIISGGSLSLGFIANLSSSTTYKIRGYYFSATSGSGSLQNSSPQFSQFYAIRIA